MWATEDPGFSCRMFWDFRSDLIFPNNVLKYNFPLSGKKTQTPNSQFRQSPPYAYVKISYCSYKYARLLHVDLRHREGKQSAFRNQFQLLICSLCSFHLISTSSVLCVSAKGHLIHQLGLHDKPSSLNASQPLWQHFCSLSFIPINNYTVLIRLSLCYLSPRDGQICLFILSSHYGGWQEQRSTGTVQWMDEVILPRAPIVVLRALTDQRLGSQLCCACSAPTALCVLLSLHP